MPQLTNIKATNVKFVKDGTREKDGKQFKWLLYNVTVDGKKMTYFTYPGSKKKPEPWEGMEFLFIEYTEEKKGQYTNYTIKDFKLAEGSTPPPKTEPKSGENGQQRTGDYQPISCNKDLKDDPIWFGISYILEYLKEEIKESLRLKLEKEPEPHDIIGAVVPLARKMKRDALRELNMKFIRWMEKVKGEISKEDYESILNQFGASEPEDIIERNYQEKIFEIVKDLKDVSTESNGNESDKT